MIRRREGDSFMLITQHDHALLAARLMAEVGNRTFHASRRRSELIEATSLHDSGWPMHDDRPTLNGEGYPLDVFESPRSVTFPAWQAGADRAAGVSAYVGLLVSMHVLSLSALAAGMAQERRAKGAFDPSQLTDQFEMNKFQHREIERQEQLRRRLGLRTDLPVHLGLAELNVDPAEDELRADLRWLQAMDLISLALCCTSPPGRSYTSLASPART
jgi:hypothetical protein